MKTITIDARGLACPEPVLLSRKALDEIDHGEVVVYVDSDVARENIARMSKSQGCRVTVKNKGYDEFELRLIKTAATKIAKAAEKKDTAREGSIVYLFDSDHIGSNRELGKILVNGFLNAIASLPDKKSTIIFLSSGVKLTTRGSYVLEALAKLKDKSFTMLICGTCLDFYKIRDKVRIGTISNAIEIVETLTNAGKVVKF